MKKVLIISHIPFWQQSSGDKSRLYAMIKYLNSATKLTVVYGGPLTSNDLVTLDIVRHEIEILFFGRGKALTMEQYHQLFANLFASRNFDVCIIEYLHLSVFLPMIPEETTVMLDTHDLISDRLKSFEKFGIEISDLPNLTSENEYAQFEKFDFIILIQKNDFDKVSKVLDPKRLILSPHPVITKKQLIRKKVKNIGFVGSSYLPNIDAIKWFIENVWIHMSDDNILLNIYGEVGNKLDIKNLKRVKRNGFIPDLNSIYNETDILINPVRFGAGLKIKNIEALANGLPLITTTHGPSGFENEAEKSFLLADDPDKFFFNLIALIENYDLRKSLSDNAFELATKHFTPEACFKDLLLKINEQ